MKYIFCLHLFHCDAYQRSLSIGYPISKYAQVTCQGWKHNRVIVPAMAAGCVMYYSLEYFYLSRPLQEIMAANILVCSARRLNIPARLTNSRPSNVLY